jgi:MtN3 and saliva related transmembrane protein
MRVKEKLTIKEMVAVIFGLGLLVNAGLFVPQIISILRARSSEGVSFLTFAGFSVLQMAGILHGYFQGDRYLMFGMIASLLTCGSVVILTLVYWK